MLCSGLTVYLSSLSSGSRENTSVVPFKYVQLLKVFTFQQHRYRLGRGRGRCTHCQGGASDFLLLLRRSRVLDRAKLGSAVPSNLGSPVFLPEEEYPWWIGLCVINSSAGAFSRGWLIKGSHGLLYELAFQKDGTGQTVFDWACFLLPEIEICTCLEFYHSMGVISFNPSTVHTPEAT